MNQGYPAHLIAGQGLAGTCLAWRMWMSGAPFTIADDGGPGSSSVAAGLVNPITGRNFEPSGGFAEHHAEASGFYQKIERITESRFWRPMPVLRLASSDHEWEKIMSKLDREDVRPWISSAAATVPPGPWTGAVELRGGGRLDTRTFLTASREFFRSHGVFREEKVVRDTDRPPTIWCEGATGLMNGSYGPHRCAKGEILTLRATSWDESSIRIGAGGWLVPTGNTVFKAGATYDWDPLDREPSPEGRRKVMAIAAALADENFEVVGHEVGIRPILRRSDPLLARLPAGDWLFNGLGSKGSLYAPGTAARLTDWILDNIEPPVEYLYRTFPQLT